MGPRNTTENIPELGHWLVWSHHQDPHWLPAQLLHGPWVSQIQLYQDQTVLPPLQLVAMSHDHLQPLSQRTAVSLPWNSQDLIVIAITYSKSIIERWNSDCSKTSWESASPQIVIMPMPAKLDGPTARRQREPYQASARGECPCTHQAELQADSLQQSIQWLDAPPAPPILQLRNSRLGTACEIHVVTAESVFPPQQSIQWNILQKWNLSAHSSTSWHWILKPKYLKTWVELQEVKVTSLHAVEIFYSCSTNIIYALGEPTSPFL